jgi:uncharacterized protein (DUF885 family)
MTKVVRSVACIIFIFASCKKEIHEEKIDRGQEFDILLDHYYEDGLILKPLLATSIGDNRYNDQFSNTLDEETIAKLRSHYTKYKQEIAEYNDENLSEIAQVSKAVLNWECDINLGGLEFKKPKYLPLDQTWSLNLQIGQLAGGNSAQPFKTVEDYYNWLKRLEGYLDWMASAESNMRKGVSEGYVLPKSLIVKVIPQLEAMTTEDLKEHLFFQPVKKFPDDFTEEDKNELTEVYETMVVQKIVPAYKSLYNFMKGVYLDAGRESSGINALPEGKEYYQYQIKKYTTTNMTPTEIHELGLSEVARIRDEMEIVKQRLDFEGDLKAFFDHVRSKPELMPFTSPQQVIDNFKAIHDRMKPQVENLFDLKPKSSFEIRRTEAFREKSASAQYRTGSKDGTRPGIFYVPIPDVNQYNTFSDEALFLHEAIPGHHYQVSLNRENEGLPDFRKTLGYSCYNEGWALYCESLGKELGLYTDPYQYFGMLSGEMHRAIRLVVDTGLHFKGWTREQAIQYSLENEAEPEASIISEIERYMANPGQALSYKIGQLKIKALRTKAETELGDKFDIREFHNQVLKTGPVPLVLLEDKIVDWIDTNKL